MATRGTTDGRGGRPVRRFLPLDPGHALSFALGERLTADADAVETFEHARSPSLARLFPATDHTYIFALRTPAGHRHFYEIDADAATQLADADDWDRT